MSLPNLIDERDKTEERKRRASESNTSTINPGRAGDNQCPKKVSRSSASRDDYEYGLAREPAYLDIRESLTKRTPDFYLEQKTLNRKGTFGSLGMEITPDSLDSAWTLKTDMGTSINKHSKPI